MGAVLRLVAVLGVVALGFGCAQPSKPLPEPPRPSPAGDAGPIHGICPMFCQVVRNLGCPKIGPGKDEIEGSADDTTCEEVCTTLLNTGHFNPDKGCLEQATTCERADDCLMGDEHGQ